MTFPIAPDRLPHLFMKPISLLLFLAWFARPVLADDVSRLVDIGGRNLHLAVRGSGSPTIVIEAGMGEPPIESGSWNAVVEELSKSNRVVLYDRAGLGRSDPAPKLPRTSAEVAADLERIRLESSPERLQLEEMEIPARKTDIAVDDVVLAP